MKRSELFAKTREAFVVGMPEKDVEAKLVGMGQEWSDWLTQVDPAPAPMRMVITAPLYTPGLRATVGKALPHTRESLKFVFDQESKLETVRYERSELGASSDVRQQVVP